MEREVAVLADFGEFDEEVVTDVVVAGEFRVVDQTGDVVGEVDEDAVLHDTVDGGVVVAPLLHVLGRAAGGEPEDDLLGGRLGVAVGGRSHYGTLGILRV